MWQVRIEGNILALEGPHEEQWVLDLHWAFQVRTPVLKQEVTKRLCCENEKELHTGETTSCYRHRHLFKMIKYRLDHSQTLSLTSREGTVAGKA